MTEVFFIKNKCAFPGASLVSENTETITIRRIVMAFGPIMHLQVPQKSGEDALEIELAPLCKEVMGAFIADGGMQNYPVVRFLTRRVAPVLEDELEWFEKVRTDKASVYWGIWVRSGDTRTLIGGTALESIEYGTSGINQATSGVLILNKADWGQGISSQIHKARTWFAFSELGIARIKSAVIQGNTASLRALEKSGYTLVYVERNSCFTDGALRHQDNLECLNPLEPFWSTWWGEDTPSEVAHAARARSSDALEWAKEHVTLP
jgi:RimJ/RimL family protein N-acetyltransferase